MIRPVIVELKAPEPRPVQVDPADSAFVIIDMQNEYLKPGGKRVLERGGRALGNLVPLLGRAREAGSRIIHVQSVRTRDCLEHTLFEVEPKLLIGTWGAEIAAELTPRPSEPIVQKRSHDPFNNTSMEQTLSRLGLVPGRSHVVVTGVATQGCVDCAVVGFSVRDYWVHVPLDCTAAASEELELMGFAHFFGRGYDYNVTPTRSDLITFTSRAETRPQPVGDLRSSITTGGMT